MSIPELQRSGDLRKKRRADVNWPSVFGFYAIQSSLVEKSLARRRKKHKATNQTTVRNRFLYIAACFRRHRQHAGSDRTRLSTYGAKLPRNKSRHVRRTAPTRRFHDAHCPLWKRT